MHLEILTSCEIALAHLVRIRYLPEAGKISAAINFAPDSVRILLFRSRVLESVSPVIIRNRENGEDQQSIMETVYAKLLLELDRSHIHSPAELFLSGTDIPDNTFSYLSSKLPDVQCTYLTDNPALDVSLLDNNEENEVESFAIPIGLAASVVQKKNDTYKNADFLPEQVHKEQSSARLAWHGYAALLLLFFSSLFYTIQWNNLIERKEQAQFSMSLVESALQTEYLIANEIAELNIKTDSYRNAITMVDSLWDQGPLYSGFLNYLSNTVRELNSLWVRDFTLNDKAFKLNGTSLYRNRIHHFASRFDNTEIDIMQEEEIREHTVYNFELSGEAKDGLLFGKEQPLLLQDIHAGLGKVLLDN